ncbi:hypothetical protein OCU04_000266 [Sclerotinia nivalis]|uniref:Uncharacterized protein n=1 Tax=Sclerotinia nivalis TaxID=352851 RepID=A0A9X0AVQ2_9HELO|nr:hypothetical protein OCU04_000266 [Sclerotinia nivalis]
MGLHKIFFNIYKAINSARVESLQDPDLEEERAIEKKAEEEKKEAKKEKELKEQRAKEIEEMREQKLFEEWTSGYISWKELQAKKEKARMEKVEKEKEKMKKEKEKEEEKERKLEEAFEKKMDETEKIINEHLEWLDMKRMVHERYGVYPSEDEWRHEQREEWTRLIGCVGMNGGFNAVEPDEDEVDGDRDWERDEVSVREMWC